MSRHRFLAFDYGAESGRAFAGTLSNERLELEEVHRFANSAVEVGGTSYWDILALYQHLLIGMREYVQRYGETVDGIGIDTWGVDFGLLASDGSLLQNPVTHRDARTTGMVEAIQARLDAMAVFSETAMAFSPVTSSAQLMSLRLCDSPMLAAASTLLMLPDLLGYFLTGRRVCERTNAVSTQLYNPRTGAWSTKMLAALDLPPSIFPELIDPGTVVGALQPRVCRQVGLRDGTVIAPCTHDTPSAVVAIPGEGEHWAFISSGTWSVLGALTGNTLYTSPDALTAGFVNELTLDSFFLAKNIMGLWLLQQARAAWRLRGESYSYAELVALAEQEQGGGPLIYPNDPSFLAPPDMPQAIEDFCLRTGQTAPESVGAVTRCLLESLALSYREGVDELTRIRGKTVEVVHIGGGGSQNTLLCRYTANACGVPVIAGPTEATVIGNVLVQARTLGLLRSAAEIRAMVRQSFSLQHYQPEDTAAWAERYAAYLGLRTRVAS